MTTPTPGRSWTTPPPVEPYTYGLLNAATIEDGGGPWRIGGVEYDTHHCATGGYVVGSCPVPAGGTQAAEVTVTAEASTGEGFEYGAASPDDPNRLRFTADPNLPGPLTVHLTRAAPPRVSAALDGCDDTGSTVTLTVNNAHDPVAVVLHPGAYEDVELAEGTWTVTTPGCEPQTVELPLASPDPEQQLGQCKTVAAQVTVTSSSSSDFPVAFTLGDLHDTLAPGQAVTRYLYAGTYALDLTAPGGAARATVTVPGQPVTLAVERTPTTHDKQCSYGTDHVQSPPPFTVYACYECQAVGSEDPQPAALSRLACVENREVEEFFSRHVLAEADRFPVGQDPVGLDLALGVLEEDAARHYCGQPTFHAPRWTQPFFSHHRLVREVGPHLRTWLRSKVAFGGGYLTDPFDPEASGRGEFWLFATGTVRAHRAPPFVNETFRPRDNLRLAIAERTYLLDHDCYLAAVKVTAPLQGGGA